MARSTSNDGRNTFHIDRLRFLIRSVDPPVAPEKNTCEIYIKNGELFKINDAGQSSPVNGVGVSASPGFTWGRKGNINSVNKPYLLNDEVPSNVTGRFVAFQNPTLRKILVTSGSVSTFTVTIQEHDGTTFTDLVAVNIVASRGTVVDLAVPITTGKELATKVTSGSCADPVVGVIIDGLL